MPRASSRSSEIASSSSRSAPSSSSSAPSASSSSRVRAVRSVSASETSRCCAPSCRLRSSPRRSAMPTSISRMREARSSSTRARSSASRRSFSSASAVALPTASTSSGSSSASDGVVDDRGHAVARRAPRATARGRGPAPGSSHRMPARVHVGRGVRAASRRASASRRPGPAPARRAARRAAAPRPGARPGRPPRRRATCACAGARRGTRTGWTRSRARPAHVDRLLHACRTGR